MASNDACTSRLKYPKILDFGKTRVLMVVIWNVSRVNIMGVNKIYKEIFEYLKFIRLCKTLTFSTTA